jgi:hypothetical protein
MALWTPAKITTALWLDAADSSTLFDAVSGGSLVAADGAVARWEDKSGNGRHATQSGGTARPLRKVSAINSMDSLRFDGSNDNLKLSDRALLRNLPGVTVFFVAKSATSAAGERILFSAFVNANTGNMHALGQLANQGRYGGRRVSGTAGDFSNAGTFDTSTTLIVAQQRWSVAQKQLWIHGTSVDNDLAFQDAGNSENLDSFADPTIGSNSANDFLFNGDIAECVLLQSSAITADQQLIEGYLAWKWGTEGSLPNDHPYKNAAPRTGALVTIIRQHYAAQGAR